MAAPGVSYSETVQAAHSQGVGFSWRGFVITSKELLYERGEAGSIWSVTITKAGNTWLVHYSSQQDGTVGRIYNLWDDEGAVFHHDGLDGWRQDG